MRSYLKEKVAASNNVSSNFLPSVLENVPCRVRDGLLGSLVVCSSKARLTLYKAEGGPGGLTPSSNGQERTHSEVFQGRNTRKCSG
jgi:hypothetical protein